MKELIDHADASKEKKLALSLGMLLCTVTCSAVAVFSFYQNMPVLATAAFSAGEVSLVGGSFLFGAAFWQKPVWPEGEEKPLIVANEGSETLKNEWGVGL